MNKNQEEDILGDNHIATSAVTPLRADAFQMSETEKIAEIETHVRAILHTLGMDLTDDSLKGTPKRVAKMFVKRFLEAYYQSANLRCLLLRTLIIMVRCW